MIHFHGNPNCSARRSRDISSTADDLEEYSNLYRSDPWRYCSECLTPESIRTDTDRYAELRALVEAWQHWQREPRYDQADAPERLMDWSHR